MIDSSAFQGKKAAYFTLGCKLNFSETSTFGRMLQELGVTTVQKGEKADICLINTCSVTDVADHKCRQAIHRLVRQHPDAFVVVTGCYAQLAPSTASKARTRSIKRSPVVFPKSPMFTPVSTISLPPSAAAALACSTKEAIVGLRLKPRA